MHIWIDIDNVKHVAFFKAIITELNKRNHEVIVTALDKKEITETLKEHQINAKVIGEILPIFGLFEKFFQMYRVALLKRYLSSRDPNLAFSLGSSSILTTCAYLKLPLVVLLHHPMQKIQKYHFGFKKCCYIVSDVIPEETITKYLISTKRIRKYKSIGDKEAPYTIHQSLVEICDHLDSLSNCISEEIDA